MHVKSTCEYCKGNVKHHLVGCPHGATDMILVWQQGRLAAKSSQENPHPDDATFTLGFECDRPAREDRDEPPSRRSIPSITELELARDDRDRDPSVRPGMHPVQAILVAERAARMADPF